MTNTNQNPWAEETHPMHLAVQEYIHEAGEAGIVYARILAETGLKRKVLDTILEKAIRFGGIEKLKSGQQKTMAYRRPPFSATSYDFVMPENNSANNPWH